MGEERPGGISPHNAPVIENFISLNAFIFVINNTKQIQYISDQVHVFCFYLLINLTRNCKTKIQGLFIKCFNNRQGHFISTFSEIPLSEKHICLVISYLYYLKLVKNLLHLQVTPLEMHK